MAQPKPATANGHPPRLHDEDADRPSITESTTLRALSTPSPSPERRPPYTVSFGGAGEEESDARTTPRPCPLSIPPDQLEAAETDELGRNASGLTLDDVRKLDHEQLARMTWLILGARSVDDMRPIVRTLRTFFGKTAKDSMDENREESDEENGVDVLDEEMDEGEDEDEEEEEDARWTHGKISAWNHAATPAFEDGESEETISFEETGEEREGACSASLSH
ncbi:hypothetical protein GTA08_BOTSDO13809 [Botryosphaeria dothidea]|uniref:Uncharacterized protein n=1 Tax=Botryosphaeria dothidea TaxID=55169 RepID=A0A8H4J110_9PEZI|nr:hypothetical protein GTA08_BOTSDO13809 [Botryosphaeria dothidea]